MIFSLFESKCLQSFDSDTIILVLNIYNIVAQINSYISVITFSRAMIFSRVKALSIRRGFYCVLLNTEFTAGQRLHLQCLPKTILQYYLWGTIM